MRGQLWESVVSGLFMIDEEGVIQTVEVSAKFVNGKPEAIEAKYYMKTSTEWDRFMRWMERYAEENGLGFQKVRPVHTTSDPFPYTV